MPADLVLLVSPAAAQVPLLDTAEELAGVELDPYKSLADMGADSLDTLEVVSCRMRELPIKLPRAQLANLENMDQLVDLLHRVVLEG